MDGVFETPETADDDMITTRSTNTINTIVNRKFGNNFHRHNGPNQSKNVHKQKSQQYQYITLQISNIF